ncbi:MAG: ribbon-helix-helix protein, CopG family [Methanomassiliicoccaceae archaeon]|jgi:Arc/MetJ-type ribon-helix-helix transcriptional regulator|nr:ribbon-helix-helix protein, CopG family [Methanomassiliicoccaceae archaeon]
MRIPALVMILAYNIIPCVIWMFDDDLSDQRQTIVMSQTERITVRLPSDKAELVQTLVDRGDYANVSDVIREALDEFLKTRFATGNSDRVTVELPKAKVIELETLVQDGDSVSLDDAIRNAVREYTRARLRTD